ncbi:MAG: hypothetical protein U5L04_10050 [Trueperaceae bacterium]|nr:hypothetical protein [Trueperaceae bacterium]
MSATLPAAPEAFVAEGEGFSGTLAELADGLRRGDVLPAQVRGLELVRSYLVYYRRLAAVDPDLASETLPLLARVLELKARLLLPAPPRGDDDGDDTVELVAIVDELAGLEDAITFLRERRAARRLLLPASAPRPPYPRPPRPHRVGPGRLAELAARYRPGRYFELARERFTLAAAIGQLRALLKRLRDTTLFRVTRGDGWGRRTMFFAGMLELVKEGEVEAEQLEPYADIALHYPARPAPPDPPPTDPSS